MTRNRAALAIPAALVVLSGCGVAAAATARTTTVSDVISKPTVAVASLPLRALPRPEVVPVAQVVPSTPHPAPSTYVVSILTAGATQWLEIRSHTGAVVAKTTINPILGWMVEAGAGGAYWSQGGAEYELTPSGAVHKLGLVPADANGVVIAPDGTSYAYTTNDTAKNGLITNRIVVVRQGAAPVTIADRIDDPNHPPADAPSAWQYYLITWNSSGIAFARVPVGGCGCGSFDMQMQSAFSASINPVTGVVTTLTASASCPLSAVGTGMETACFAGTTTTTSLRVSIAGVLRHSFTMSGTTVAGDAVFSPAGTELAYVTIPAAEDTCGATWNATLRVLNLATGAAVSRTLGEFTPAVWGSDGLLYGSIASNSGSDASLVAVNPATLAVAWLTPAITGQQFIGIM
ncbi:MAG: hypothetical protein ACHQ4F_14800 [Candidatus Dormibacteria bacterium]